MDWAEIYLRTKVVKWYLDSSSSLATTDMGRKVGGAVPLFTGVGSPSNNVAWAETYLRINWHLASCSRLATIQGPKLGGAAVPPFWGERRYLVNTTEPSVCGGDAALCQITLTTCWNILPSQQMSAAIKHVVDDNFNFVFQQYKAPSHIWRTTPFSSCSAKLNEIKIAFFSFGPSLLLAAMRTERQRLDRAIT